jgi:Icc-related predicted phosphoesterase
MRIIHISDTHGTFPTLPEGDLVVHSGDFCPNASRGNLQIEPSFQTNWLRTRVETFREWLGGRPLLLCNGNHDFVLAAQVLADLGVNAIDLTNKFVAFQGINFYGFPYIPFIAGEWNYELMPQDMVDEMRRMRLKLADAPAPVDILVAHAPPWGICDFDPKYKQHFGNSVLTNSLVYGQFEPAPKHIFSGHIHQANGYDEILGVKVSQAGTVIHVIEWNHV